MAMYEIFGTAIGTNNKTYTHRSDFKIPHVRYHVVINSRLYKPYEHSLLY